MYSITNSFETSETFSSIHSIISDIILTYKEFVNESFDLASKKMIDLKNKLEKSSKISKEDQRIFLQHDFEPRKMQIATLEFQTTHSSIGYLYSQLDILLLRIAEATKELNNSKVSIKDYRNKCIKFNKDIIKFKHYLIDTFKFEFNSFENNWTEIENFKKIRNYLIHQNGISISDKKFIDYVNSKSGLKFENDVLIVSKEYLIEISDQIKNFLFKIMDKIYETSK